MVCSSLAGGDVKTLALSDVGEKRGLVPWVGVAARAPNPTPTLDTTEGAVETAPDDDEPGPGSGSGSVPPRSESLRGRAFCFLPLPVLTGLPVHVNATFELSSNRRDVWRPEDAAGGGAARGEWNEKLLADAVAPASSAFCTSSETIPGPSAYASKMWRRRVVSASCCPNASAAPSLIRRPRASASTPSSSDEAASKDARRDRTPIASAVL